jgi:undecaprenyl diphosphate synthase
MLSSTLTTPVTCAIPRHVAIIMDGNGRWAQDRRRLRTEGHVRGVQAVREVVRACGRKGVKFLTLFAFSTENWRRPADEVSLLMRLFVRALGREVATLAKQGVRLRVVGDLSAFDSNLQTLIHRAEAQTAGNTKLMLTIAANYGGRWDILQATRGMLAAQPWLAARPDEIIESALDPYLSMAWAPEPDLFIRTGGEQRISNFLIWQLAYTELYFTDQYWPDFNEQALLAAFKWYETRERRFGRISAQIPANGRAVA